MEMHPLPFRHPFDPVEVHSKEKATISANLQWFMRIAGVKLPPFVTNLGMSAHAGIGVRENWIIPTAIVVVEVANTSTSIWSVTPEEAYLFGEIIVPSRESYAAWMQQFGTNEAMNADLEALCPRCGRTARKSEKDPGLWLCHSMTCSLMVPFSAKVDERGTR